MIDLTVLTIAFFGLLVACVVLWELKTIEKAQLARDERNAQRRRNALVAGRDVYLYELPSGTETCYAPVNDYDLHVRRTSAPS